MTQTRSAAISRKTNETDIELELTLGSDAPSSISTGIGFLDHMLAALSKHAGFSLALRCAGDLDVDDHHSAEDCALALGQAFDRALGDRAGIVRFGSAYAPLDEALCRCVLDFSGRPYASVNLDLRRDMIGAIACENITHFFESFAIAARCTLHLDLIRGVNDHHKAEAGFKSCALALRQAIAVRTGDVSIPSTKGTLS